MVDENAVSDETNELSKLNIYIWQHTNKIAVISENLCKKTRENEHISLPQMLFE